jgi:hypothetical protein
MNESEHLEPIVRPLFVVKQKAWNGSNKVEYEVSLEVAAAYGAEVLVGSAVLNEIKEDFDRLNDINGELYLVKCFLGCVMEFIGFNSVVHFSFDVNFFEYDNVWEYNQIVNNQQSDEKVPNNARVFLCVY